MTDILPIDHHKDRILDKIKTDRVVIIHGETGCGKSSRLPVMIYEDAMARGKACRMMVSQPRRIAASSLMKRVRGSLGDKVGMRMGHGIKDESSDTCIHFVTTGYIVRLLAHHPSSFRNHTHLIIDEVHERSVDGDVLCLLARSLLTMNPSIRIILMSATVHTELYRTYFTEEGAYNGDMECLSVGVRRFPIKTVYLDDILGEDDGGRDSGETLLGSDKAMYAPLKRQAKKLMEVIRHCSGKYDEQVPLAMAKEQYSLAVSLIRQVAVEGSGVLVFVSGISDITALQESLDGVPRYKIYVIHSDIPFEEQEAAFLPCPPDEVKIILATNAAESSITLPDVDCVICLGTHKSTRYSAGSHRVQLVNSWISKASGTQRAGRTGRVRPGSVYRLYSRFLFDHFQDHELSEVHRTPLQDVILNMRNMFDSAPDFDGVVPILQSLLEPPSINNITKSFDYLYDAKMITCPDDSGDLTALGRFAGEMPVDLQLSRMIALGICLGIKNEAVVMASAISQPRSMFRIVSPLIHKDPDEFNDIVVQTYLGASKLDGGVFSEPIMYLKAYMTWMTMNVQMRSQWIRDHGLVFARFTQFVTSTTNLLKRVNDSLKNSRDDKIKVKNFLGDDPNTWLDSELSAKKLNLLRLLLAWTSDGNFLRMKEEKDGGKKKETGFYDQIIIESPELTENHLSAIFPPEVQWSLDKLGKRMYDGAFSASRLDPFDGTDVLADMVRSTLTSYVPLIWLYDQTAGADPVSKGKARGSEAKGVLVVVVSEEEPDAFEDLDDIFGDRLESMGYLEGLREQGHVFIVVKPSNKELKRLNELHEAAPACMAMNVPKTGHPKLICTNFIPSQQALNRIFFGDEAEVANRIHKDDLSSPQNKKYKIAVQITGSKQILLFDNSSAEEATADINKPKSHRAAEKQSAVAPLFKEPPLGYRIINSLRAGYKNKFFIVWGSPRRRVRAHNSRANLLRGVSDTAVKETARSGLTPLALLKKGVAPARSAADGHSMQASAPAFIPGSAEYIAEHAPADETGKKTAVDEEEKWTVKVKSSMTSWECRNVSLQSEGRFMMAVLAKQSVSIVAHNTGAGSLYACPHQTLEVDLGQGSRKCMIVAEKVTIFPPGSRWVSLALMCAGLSPGMLLQAGRSRRNVDECDVAIDEEDEEYCSLVQRLVTETSVDTIQTSDDLIDLISELFCIEQEQGEKPSKAAKDAKKVKLAAPAAKKTAQQSEQKPNKRATADESARGRGFGKVPSSLEDVQLPDPDDFESEGDGIDNIMLLEGIDIDDEDLEDIVFKPAKTYSILSQIKKHQPPIADLKPTPAKRAAVPAFVLPAGASFSAVPPQGVASEASDSKKQGPMSKKEKKKLQETLRKEEKVKEKAKEKKAKKMLECHDPDCAKLFTCEDALRQHMESKHPEAALALEQATKATRSKALDARQVAKAASAGAMRTVSPEAKRLVREAVVGIKEGRGASFSVADIILLCPLLEGEDIRAVLGEAVAAKMLKTSAKEKDTYNF